MIVGVGSGSTIYFFIKLLSEMPIHNLRCIPTSYDTKLLLKRFGLRLVSFLEVDRVDIAIDGADSILLQKRLLIKGGGGALLREKIVDYSANKLVIIADESKLNREYPIPIEILPFAYSSLLLRTLGKYGKPKLRYANMKLGPLITDNGNWIIDLEIDLKDLTPPLEVKLNSIPGVLENGIFTKSSTIVISKKNGEIIEEKI